MHTLNELDLIRQRREDLLREAKNDQLARRLRLPDSEEIPNPSLIPRRRTALRPASKEAGVENGEG
ncbi:MAG: hypothetical protein ACFB50_00025 [Rubrobacteraceae bacterium]